MITIWLIIVTKEIHKLYLYNFFRERKKSVSEPTQQRIYEREKKKKQH